MSEQFTPIKIIEIIASEVGVPRNDGTPGSALYSVPFRLSASAPQEWGQLFVHAWDNPSSFSSMHRPGIARVYGSQVVLDGTTIEEIEKHHKKTLELAANEANEKYSQLLRRRQEAEAKKQEKERIHRDQVEQAAKKIKFD